VSNKQDEETGSTDYANLLKQTTQGRVEDTSSSEGIAVYYGELIAKEEIDQGRCKLVLGRRT
jgi:hypothetical protein